MPARLAALALCSLAWGACCNDEGATRGRTQPPRRKDAQPRADDRRERGSSRCGALRARVAEIYRRAQGPPPKEKEKRDLRAELLQANVHMILTDCRKDPDRFVPCIAEAETVETLESECIVPLDDEGKVEGRRFGRD